MLDWRQLVQFARYTLWHSMGLTLPLAVDRLIVCPILNERLGHSLFGGYVWVMGIMNLVGNIAANGFALLLMRDLSRQSADEAGKLVQTSNLLSGGMTVVTVALACAAAWRLADEAVRENAWAIFLPLGAYTILRSFQYIALTVVRVQNRGFTLFASKLAEALVLLSLVWIAGSRNLWWIGAVYVASVVFSLPVAWVGGAAIGPAAWDGAAARWLMAGWLAGAILTVADQAQVYAARVMLGAMSSDAQVAVFYAGSSIGNLFVFPVGLLASSLLSLLAPATSFALGGRRSFIFLLLTALIAVVVGVISYSLGKYVIELQYPDLAAHTLEFYSWIALANGCSCVGLFMRPVAVKYGQLRRVMWVSIGTVAVQIGSLAALVPSGEARGAAISFAISSAVGAGLWLVYFMWLRQRAERD